MHSSRNFWQDLNKCWLICPVSQDWQSWVENNTLPKKKKNPLSLCFHYGFSTLIHWVHIKSFPESDTDGQFGLPTCSAQNESIIQ